MEKIKRGDLVTCKRECAKEYGITMPGVLCRVVDISPSGDRLFLRVLKPYCVYEDVVYCIKKSFELALTDILGKYWCIYYALELNDYDKCFCEDCECLGVDANNFKRVSTNTFVNFRLVEEFFHNGGF